MQYSSDMKPRKSEIHRTGNNTGHTILENPTAHARTIASDQFPLHILSTKTTPLITT
jgi:hypothetical protein